MTQQSAGEGVVEVDNAKESSTGFLSTPITDPAPLAVRLVCVSGMPDEAGESSVAQAIPPALWHLHPEPRNHGARCMSGASLSIAPPASGTSQ